MLLAFLLVAAVSETPQVDEVHRTQEGPIFFEDRLAVMANGTTIAVSSYSVPKVGKYGREMPWSEFYETVGRTDLAERYAVRRNTKLGLSIGGGIGAVAGIGLLIGGVAARHSAPTCFPGDATCAGTGFPFTEVGVTTVAISAVAFIVGVLLPLQPAEPHEVREMADKYNQSLESDTATPSKSQTTVRLQLTPSVTPRSAAMTLSATF